MSDKINSEQNSGNVTITNVDSKVEKANVIDRGVVISNDPIHGDIFIGDKYISGPEHTFRNLVYKFDSKYVIAIAIIALLLIISAIWYAVVYLRY